MGVFNRKIKDHTTKKYDYDTVESLEKHLMTFFLAYNFQRPLKSLKFKSPYDLRWLDKSNSIFVFDKWTLLFIMLLF